MIRLASLYGRLREELALVDRLLADPTYQSAGFIDELTERAARLRYRAAQIGQSRREVPTAALELPPSSENEEPADKALNGGH